jgi:hypothetical protein
MGFYIAEPGGILTIRRGYRWDGATNGGEDEIYNHRSSLLHDALYDLMRMGYLEPDLFDIGDPSECDNAGDFNRKMADMVYYMIAVEDGESVEKAESDFVWIRTGGWIGTSTDFQLKDWKFHISDLTAYTSKSGVMLEWRKSNVFQQNSGLAIDKSYVLMRNGEI